MGGIIRRKKRPAPPPPAPAPPPPPAAPTSVTGAGKGGMDDSELQLSGEVAGSRQLKRRRRGKRALVGQTAAAAQVGGEGTSGLNIPKG